MLLHNNDTCITLRKKRKTNTQIRISFASPYPVMRVSWIRRSEWKRKLSTHKNIILCLTIFTYESVVFKRIVSEIGNFFSPASVRSTKVRMCDALFYRWWVGTAKIRPCKAAAGPVHSFDPDGPYRLPHNNNTKVAAAVCSEARASKDQCFSTYEIAD